MEIDITTLPVTTRERLQNIARENEKTARCAEFARIACTDTASAGDYLLAMNDYEQLDAIRTLEQNDLVTFVRASSSRVRAKILEVHPNPGWLRRELTPDADVVRLVRVTVPGWQDTDDSAYHREQLAARDTTEHTIVAKIAPGSLPRARGLAFYSTSPCDVTREEAEHLIGVGCAGLVKEPKRETVGYANGQRTPQEPWRYRGCTVEGQETWRADALIVIRSVDRELDRAIVDGKLVVEPMSIDECRARMSVRP